MMSDFSGFGLLWNIVIFGTAAGFVWVAGSRITLYASAISEKTGLSRALLGLLLLASVTSLPELAVSLTSAWSGNAPLAVNNILGGVAMQVAFLAIADFLLGRRALTSVVPDPVVMLQGSVNIIILAVVAMAVLVGDTAVLGIGYWSWLIAALVVLGIREIAKSSGRKPWLANTEIGGERRIAGNGDEEGELSAGEGSLASLIAKAAAAGAVILVAGFAVSRSGEAIGELTGIGPSFAGAILLALATSLPEISTVTAAVRMRLYTMAISDILGTTIFNLGLLFAIDAVAGGDAVFSQVGTFSAFGALLCILVTALFLAGLAERRDRTMGRMGVDSLAVLIVYLGGVGILYTLR